MSKVNDITNITLPVYKRLKEELPDDVNKAIEEGSIEIPASGTKLYKHILVLSGFDDEQKPTSCEMKLYTTNKTSIAGSYTSANDVAVALSGISLYYFDGEVSYELTSAIANSLSNEVGLINVTGSAPSFLLSSNYPLTITDTVMEL